MQTQSMDKSPLVTRSLQEITEKANYNSRKVFPDILQVLVFENINDLPYWYFSQLKKI